MDELEQVTSTLLTPAFDDSPQLDRALRDTTIVGDLLTAIREAECLHASLGVHPEDDGAASISFFTLSMTGITARPASIAAAQCAVAFAESPGWTTDSGRFLDLPSGLKAALVAGTLTAPDPESLAKRGITAPPSDVFQARLTVPCPTGEHIAVADLTSAATHHAEAYTSILEAIAMTMSFAEPPDMTQPTGREHRPSRILELFS
ncbi:hypothetical protein ABZY19_16345 [Streptomyces sp. NPDC006475]|uniref:hypothetical protein n=1 Tax=Streptomyces sp. NPDC006475 TaxID=3155719 RepID=UPI0033BE8DE6